MLIGKRLKDLRKARGLSQQELGDLINVTKVSVCCYERGTRTPNLDTLQDIVNVFDVSTDYLLGNDKKVNVVSDSREPYTISIPKEIIDLINELKLDKDLYLRVMEENPKRIIELVGKLLK